MKIKKKYQDIILVIVSLLVVILIIPLGLTNDTSPYIDYGYNYINIENKIPNIFDIYIIFGCINSMFIIYFILWYYPFKDMKKESEKNEKNL